MRRPPESPKTDGIKTGDRKLVKSPPANSFQLNGLSGFLPPEESTSESRVRDCEGRQSFRKTDVIFDTLNSLLPTLVSVGGADVEIPALPVSDPLND